MPICKVCGKDSFWTVDVYSKLCKDCNRSEASKKVKEVEKAIEVEKKSEPEAIKKQPLSEKYSVLLFYQVLAYLLMMASTAFTVYLFVQISEASNVMKEYGGGTAMDNAMLTLIVTYVITIFSLFCLIKIIDFLFDLDKHVSDK